MICPKCNNTTFHEIDCGPDSYEDDVFYISYKCKKCGLWLSGWTDKWLLNVDNWLDEEDAEEYK